MPYNKSQIRLFAAAAHNPEIARRKGLKMSQARRLLMENSPKRRKQAMTAMRG